MTGTLFVVATPIGHLEDISARALRTLREVSVIAAEDTRRTGALLRHFGIRTPQVSLHQHNERRRTDEVLHRLAAGESVALVSDAGTPAIADPGAALVRQARLLAFKVVPIPGPSALAAALSVAGLPDEEFAFMGFPPVRSKARNKWLSRLAERHQSMTVVCFEAPHRLLKTLSDLDFFVKSPIILLRELTKWHEQVLEGLPGELAARLHDPRGEFTLVIPAGTPAEPIVAVEQSTVTDDEIRSVFGRTAETEPRNTRRALVRHVAEVLGVPVRRVYDTTKGL